MKPTLSLVNTQAIAVRITQKIIQKENLYYLENPVSNKSG